MATTPYPFVASTVLTASQLNSTFNVPVETKTDSYTLVAADGGKRIVMNKATATTITVNTGLFSAGDSVWIHNIGAGTCTITAGTATVNTEASLALGQWGGGQLYFTSGSTAIFFRGGSKQTLSVDFLLVGGGGSGGRLDTGSGNGGGGGGGAGGFVTGSGIVGKGTYTIKVSATNAVVISDVGATSFSFARREISPSHQVRARVGSAPSLMVSSTTSTSSALINEFISESGTFHSFCKRLRRSAGFSGSFARNSSIHFASGVTGTKSGSGK